METVKTDTWMPIKDYAEKHGLTVQAIYARVKNGKIQSRKIGTYTLVRA